jgi:hypothetical protein
MAVPVINTTQSILSYRQWQANVFQATATNSPNLWRISPAPPVGMSFDSATGRVSGKPSLMGIYNFTLGAQNADGWSAPAAFTIGVYYSEGDFTSIRLNADIDVATRAVVVTPANTETPLQGQATPLLSLKNNDDLLLKVVFKKDTSPLDLQLTSLYFGVKDVDTSALILKSQISDWEKVVAQDGATVTSYYLIYMKIGSDMLTSVLSDAEADTGTFIDAYGEIEWIMDSANEVGPASLRNSTDTFRVRITRDLIA